MPGLSIACLICAASFAVRVAGDVGRSSHGLFLRGAPAAQQPGRALGCCATEEDLLFAADGGDGAYANIWPGWSSPGFYGAKQRSYDELCLEALHFRDASGNFAEFTLVPPYAGMTLLQVVQSCMPEELVNDGSFEWELGFCTRVGWLSNSSSSAVGPTGSFSTTLRLFVGNGGSDSDDWALFMPVIGNGDGDFSGNLVWAFASEDAANTGTSSAVFIYGTGSSGICATTTATTDINTAIGTGATTLATSRTTSRTTTTSGTTLTPTTTSGTSSSSSTTTSGTPSTTSTATSSHSTKTTTVIRKTIAPREVFSAEGADSAHRNTWLGWFNTRSRGAARRPASDGTRRVTAATTTTREDLLFSAEGADSAYGNTWLGWFNTGSHGAAKRPAYDELCVGGLHFRDATGRFAEYTLTALFRGLTLLEIVQRCMPSTPAERQNNGSATWDTGHCPNIGSLADSSGVTGVASALRVGVGDGGRDSDDWALFMPLTGNGNGDFAGSGVWAFGSEGSANTGFSGTVQIYGILASGCHPTATREDLLFSAEGADSAYGNTWLGWFNSGSHGAAKRPAYDEPRLGGSFSRMPQAALPSTP